MTDRTLDPDFDLAYVAIETDIETLRDRLVYEFPFNKPLVEALIRRIDELHAKERVA